MTPAITYQPPERLSRTPVQARAKLESALDAMGLSATQAARIMPLADEYAAASIRAYATSPASQGGSGNAPVISGSDAA